MESLPSPPRTPERQPEGPEDRPSPRLHGPNPPSKLTVKQAPAENDAQQQRKQTKGGQEEPKADSGAEDKLEHVPMTGLEPIINLPAKIEASTENGTLELTLSTVISNLLMYTRAAGSEGALCAW